MTYQVKKPVSKFAFQVHNLRRYIAWLFASGIFWTLLSVGVTGGALHVESS
jgi:hypothetical protein